MSSTTFTIRTVPIGQGRPRFARRGKFSTTYTDSKTRDYEYDLKGQALPYAPDVPHKGPIKLYLKFFKPKPKSKPKRIVSLTTKPDMTNMVKSVEDALNGLFWHDDSQIIELHSTKEYDDTPRIEVSIYFLPKE